MPQYKLIIAGIMILLLGIILLIIGIKDFFGRREPTIKSSLCIFGSVIITIGIKMLGILI